MPIKSFVNKVLKKAFTPSLEISKISADEIEECLDVCAAALSHVMSPEGVKGYTKTVADWNLSVKAKYGDKIVGCYVFNKNPVTSYAFCSKEDLSRYKKMKGVQGVALAVLPEYRDLGIGKKLRRYPLEAGFDYIWGLHMKSLHNIDNWVRFGRRIICETSGMFATLMDISSKAKSLTAEYNKTNQKDDSIENLSENEFGEFHAFQKAGHTCGPTCVQMVADFFGAGYEDIDEIIDLCGCNTKTGTVDTGIKNALDSLGIPNERNPYIGDLEMSMDYLNELLNDGNMFVMRTLTKGVKHWIVVYGKIRGKYLVADPWLGKITYDRNQVLEIWRPRDFDGFMVRKT